jgi:hypothetical protein
MSSNEAVATATVDAAGMVTITGVAAGTATITVTGMDAMSGMSAMQMIMVTVMDEPMPPMPASNLMAEANGDGTVTLTWMPGENANQHFVAGTADGSTYAVWAYASEMGTFTTMADLLTIGAEYRFWILAGQWEQEADGDWVGTWAADGWSNVATATPRMASAAPPPPPAPGGG